MAGYLTFLNNDALSYRHLMHHSWKHKKTEKKKKSEKWSSFQVAIFAIFWNESKFFSLYQYGSDDDIFVNRLVSFIQPRL